MNRIIMHIDVNNAFLSWTAVYLLNNGGKYDIRNSYAVIGGDETARKGIVLAKSNPAKKQGVVTGEQLYKARKKCPALRVYPMNYSYYQEMSYKLFELIKKYSPDVEVSSIDECFLDYTKVKNLYGDTLVFAKKIQQEIYDILGFTVNIGIGNNKLCAKMASDFSKPNKIHTLYMDEVQEKMWPIFIGNLFGIGKVTTEKLINLNINTIGDLARADPIKLSKYFKNQANMMISSACGINDSPVVSEEIICKGISNEITLLKDINDKKQLYQNLLFLSEKVGLRIRQQERYAYVIAVIIKDKYFKRRTHQKKLHNPTNLTTEIFEMSKQILNEMWENDTVRLIGIRLDTLVNVNHHQVSLFDCTELRKKNENLEKIMDKLNEKYGSKIIVNASLEGKKK